MFLMKITPTKLNTYTMFQLPSAYFCGVRAKHIDGEKCIVTVRHRWINQNPFKSMFWAVQGMAAEFSTGALMMMKIQESRKPISMLVVQNESVFTKKATGLITFVCNEGHLIDDAISKTLETGEGQTLWMTSIGTNEEGQEVSTFKFQWSIKVKG